MILPIDGIQKLSSLETRGVPQQTTALQSADVQSTGFSPRATKKIVQDLDFHTKDEYAEAVIGMEKNVCLNFPL